MPATRREKPIYQRGEFRLYPRSGRNHEIVWYDDGRKRERSCSAGTTDERRARVALDNEYVKKHGGVPHCGECGQPLSQRGELVTVLVANYKNTKPVGVGDAVHPRLDHLLDYMEAEGRNDDRADQVDDAWAARFREWSVAQPVVFTSGRVRQEPRAPGTTENSLIQLAAALRFGGVDPGFETIPTVELSRTPQHRSDAEELARMFRYCLYPEARSDAEIARRRRERLNLLRFLRASVATWARPDAVMDLSTDPKRGQWHPAARVIVLNPIGRRQTRKRRATVPVARQFAPHLAETDGAYIAAKSIGSAWSGMAESLRLPGAGQAGMKLVRRSVSHMARKRLGEEHWIQGRMFLGHVKPSVSDLYALLDPANLGRALAVTEAIIDEIEALAPGAYYRDLTAQGGNVASIGRAKNG